MPPSSSSLLPLDPFFIDGCCIPMLLLLSRFPHGACNTLHIMLTIVRLCECANERVHKARKLSVRYASQREIGRLLWQYFVDLDNTHGWRKLSGAQLSFDVATETPSYLSTELLRLHPFNKGSFFWSRPMTREREGKIGASLPRPSSN